MYVVGYFLGDCSIFKYVRKHPVHSSVALDDALISSAYMPECAYRCFNACMLASQAVLTLVLVFSTSWTT